MKNIKLLSSILAEELELQEGIFDKIAQKFKKPNKNKFLQGSEQDDIELPSPDLSAFKNSKLSTKQNLGMNVPMDQDLYGSMGGADEVDVDPKPLPQKVKIYAKPKVMPQQGATAQLRMPIEPESTDAARLRVMQQAKASREKGSNTEIDLNRDSSPVQTQIIKPSHMGIVPPEDIGFDDTAVAPNAQTKKVTKPIQKPIVKLGNKIF